MRDAQIVTARMLIRPLAQQDEALYCGLFSDRETMRFVGESLSEYRALRSFRAALRAHQRVPSRDIFFSVRDNQREDAVGICCLQRIDRVRQCAEIGLMLQQHVRSQGVGKEVAAALIESAFAQLSVRQIWAQYSADNAAAARLFAAIGFRPVRPPGIDESAEQVQPRVWTLYSHSPGTFEQCEDRSRLPVRSSDGSGKTDQ